MLRRHRLTVAVRCFFWACWLWPRLRWGTLLGVLGYVDKQRCSDLGSEAAPLLPESVAQTADAVVRRLPRLGVGECLLRSLVIYAVLRRRTDVEFVLGAGSLDESRRPALHCWIEANGCPLLEATDPYRRFRVLLRHRTPKAFQKP
ncbi:MAG: lasso peptide biosynthesis B2 protein [Chloracidobacterium sp.]|nr:lasso peptide biosynthesis B2 protein [Chloracidobacterium sp.]MDW8218819.1 lasso peptide biosynthesis B2 protein [Acidobacteriota bacterium]